MTLEAKPVIKNKFWIVEEQGQKIATIQAAPDGVVLVQGSKREKFVNFKLLSARHNILVNKDKKSKVKNTSDYNIYGFPTDCRPHNVLYDVRRRLPFYTKTTKSKSYFCAGHYAVFLNDQWTHHFCPKSITVSRYRHHGPYVSKEEAIGKIHQLNVVESR